MYAVSRSVLLDMAANTAVDPGLASVCSIRPDAIEVISAQVLYVVSLASQLKSCEAASSSSNNSCGASGSRQQPHSRLRAALEAVRRPRGALSATPTQLTVAIIGGGSTGCSIVNSLLSSEVLHPSSICVVSRQPDQLQTFSTKGVRCFVQEDVEPALTADIVVLACQPGQITAVAKRLAQRLRPRSLVLSVCCGISSEKIATEFHHENCLATFVDMHALSTTASRWQSEDDTMLSDMRATEITGDSLTGHGKTQNATMRSRKDGLARRRELLDVAFPSEAVHLSTQTDDVASLGASSVATRSQQGVVYYPFFDRLVWCLVELHREWSRDSWSAAESFLTVWGLLMNANLRAQMVMMLSEPETMKAVKERLLEGLGLQSTELKSPNSAADGINPGGGNTALPAPPQRLVITSEVCTISWFTDNVGMCSREALVENLRDEFVQLTLS